MYLVFPQVLLQFLHAFVPVLLIHFKLIVLLSQGFYFGLHLADKNSCVGEFFIDFVRFIVPVQCQLKMVR